MHTTIYYFTGTGNSLKIAKDLQTNLTDAKIVRIHKNTDHNDALNADRIGFIFPVYFRGLPHMLKRFVETMPVHKDIYYFAIASYGSSAAISFQQLQQILIDRGGSLSATFGISMPGNMWFMYYPHPKQDFIDRIDNEPQEISAIAAAIDHKEKNETTALITDSMAEKMYHDFNPSKMDIDFWTKDTCIGCGICAKTCPANNITIKQGRPCWQHHCEYCLACIHWCPQEAIEYKQDSIQKERYHHPAIKVQELFVK
ncbi:EFR1 family ferrodoxin [Anaerosinus massiliensis]|uniref:EFR1 family ferrodoxin n=1 Tax=Massilibacillus massiliensis TaxID=1806837 RepID=UPI000ACE1727|nr:EFR1 family ferrodoxin [Massilibacillus massiliensis]